MVLPRSIPMDPLRLRHLLCSAACCKGAVNVKNCLRAHGKEASALERVCLSERLI
jgi:hypothetical protein